MRTVTSAVPIAVAVATLTLGIGLAGAQTTGGPQKAVFPHVYPWGHNPIPTPAVGFNPAVDYDVPNYNQSPNIRKFVDSLPGLNPANANTRGKYIPVAVPTNVANTPGTPYPDADFYEITTKQFPQVLHSELPATIVRGYSQVAGTGPGQTNAAGIGGVSEYLGPLILARKFDPTRAPGVTDAQGVNGRPVRLYFHNELPLTSSNPLGTTGMLMGRTLPLPLDMTIMGAGMGPTTGVNYSDNRLSIPHLHGGRTPWISDGITHQWLTPNLEPVGLTNGANYQKGASFQNVPDMIGAGKTIVTPATGDGKATLYYSNQQSSRLMFYHDHAYGITRLNVLLGVAAGYLLVGQVEDDLINGTNASHVFDNIPGGARPILPNQAGLDLTPGAVGGGIYTYGIPLVIQDRNFVNDANTPPGSGFPGVVNNPTAPGRYHSTFKTSEADPLWASYVGTTGGNFWVSHEYMPVENIFDTVGGAVADPGTGGTFAWSAGNTTNGRWDYAPFMIPPMMPTNLTLPSPTITPESFGDTVMVNGQVFPYVTLPPDAIRFRILNAANDRSFNLQIYKAEPLTLRILNGGTGYTGGATAVIDAPPVAPGNIQATANCVVTNGVVTDIVVTNPGKGYALSPAAPPHVAINPTVAGQGAGATAFASVATEVAMVDAAPNAAYPTWPRDGRDGGVPDPTTSGPSWLQIGNEGGFLAQLAVRPPQPVDFNYNRQIIVLAGVTSTSLYLMPDNRADVIVDLTGTQPGDVYMLYNDAPAPMPYPWPINDYYTDCPDQRMAGGPGPSAPGYAPNTRTIMQIRIAGTKTSTFDFSVPNGASYVALNNAVPQAFNKDQDRPFVPQLAYNAAFPGFATADTYIQAPDTTINLTGVAQPISKIRAIAPGNNYAVAPTVSIIGGGGTGGGTASAGLNPCGAITLLTSGAGYTSAPTVTIGAPALALTPANLAVGGVVQGVQATAVATVSGGQVTSISIVEPGAGYTNTVTAPTITLTGGGATTAATASVMLPTLNTVGSVVVTTPGSYTSEPRVYLTPAAGSNGMGATAVALLNGAKVMTGKNITEGFDPDYGRMDIRMGSTPNPLTPNVGASLVVGLSRYIDPPTEFVNNGEVTLWRIGHLGVDSHPLHFHLFDVQLVNRVDWTNVVKPPYPDEIGWRDTIRTNPMEDEIVAFRPHAPVLPFQIPSSNRLLDPTTPLNSTINFLPIVPPAGVAAVAQVSNVMTNFGWEYVWHCHMLSHEENDFMRPLCLVVPPPLAPTGLRANVTVPAPGTVNVVLNWADADPTQDDDFFTIQRSTTTGFPVGPTTVSWKTSGWALTYTDTTAVAGNRYYYRVMCSNAAANSAWTAALSVIVAPAPTGLAVTAGSITRTGCTLTWTNSFSTGTGVSIQRATNTAFTAGLNTLNVNGGTVQTRIITGLRRNTTYYYRIAARVAAGTGPYSATYVTVQTLP